jgi:predicted metalloprotease with PDZ domain
VNKLPVGLSLSAVLLAAAASFTTSAFAAPAPAPSPPPGAYSGSDSELEPQLQAARKRLEEAAREVARLSSQMSGTILDGLQPYLDVRRAVIGAQLDPAPTAGGVRVQEVSPGGPAAEAGMRADDVIVAVNGTELKGSDPARQLMRIMRDIEPDSRVSVRVLREGRTRNFTVIARPGPMAVVTAHGLPDMEFGPVQIRGGFMLHGALGDMELATLTPRLGSYFGSDKGVLVVRAPADGALKLEDGDVILAIDGREPASGSHATRILGSYQPGEKITLRLLRQHKTLELQATVPAGGRSHMPGDTDLDKDFLYLEKDALRLDGDAQRRDRQL